MLFCSARFCMLGVGWLDKVAGDAEGLELLLGKERWAA